MATAQAVEGSVRQFLERPALAHALRAGRRYTSRSGSHFAAAVTYFSFLTLVPLLMLAFSVAGYVLNGRPDLLEDLRTFLTDQLPGGLAATIKGALDNAVGARLSVGLAGLVTALYTGTRWIGNLRAAIQAQWRTTFDEDREQPRESFVIAFGQNLVRLAGLGVALLVSLVLSLSGGALQPMIVRWFGLDQVGWVQPLLRVVPIVLAVAATTVIFFWIYSWMAPKDSTVPRRTVVLGAVIAAVGFEVLKQALTEFLPRMLNSPTAQVFGNIIGLLFFINFTCQLLLVVAAWIATSQVPPPQQTWRAQREEQVDRIPSAVQFVPRRDAAPSGWRIAGWVGIGTVLGAMLTRSRRPGR